MKKVIICLLFVLIPGIVFADSLKLYVENELKAGKELLTVCDEIEFDAKQLMYARHLLTNNIDMIIESIAKAKYPLYKKMITDMLMEAYENPRLEEYESLDSLANEFGLKHKNKCLEFSTP